MSEIKQLSIVGVEPHEKWKPVRDDFNFCRLAFFVSADNRSDRYRNIKQTYEVELNGKQFQAQWEVRHDPDLGLPGPFDRDVWLGIMEIVQELTESGREPVPEVIDLGSMRAFLSRLGKPANGRYMQMLKDSIRRLALTMCVSERAYNCPTSGGYLRLLKPIHIVEDAAFKGEPDGNGGVNESSWIRLGDYVRKNLEGGYIALIDASYVRLLRGDITKQLYPFLSYRFWLAVQRGRDYVAVDWRELANYLAALGWDNLSRAKQRLKRPIEELKNREYIDSSSDWQADRFVFRIGDKFLDELRTRLNARQQYRAWIDGKKQVQQLSLPSVAPKYQQPTDEEESEILLTRQAIRMALLNQEPDRNILARYGWTRDDVVSMATRLRSRQQLSAL